MAQDASHNPGPRFTRCGGNRCNILSKASFGVYLVAMLATGLVYPRERHVRQTLVVSAARQPSPINHQPPTQSPLPTQAHMLTVFLQPPRSFDRAFHKLFPKTENASRVIPELDRNGSDVFDDASCADGSRKPHAENIAGRDFKWARRTELSVPMPMSWRSCVDFLPVHRICASQLERSKLTRALGFGLYQRHPGLYFFRITR
jgi:hypothetical protein